MPFDELRQAVFEPGLCASCGMCEAACPKGLIEVAGLTAVLRDGHTASACGDCQDCLAVCPGLDPGTPQAEHRLFGRQRTSEERWLGIHVGVWGVRASDANLFARSASGGGASALLGSAMGLLALNRVLVVGRSSVEPWRAATLVCDAPDQLIAGAQSTYQLFPFLATLRTVLRDPAISAVGMSGVACHIQAVRKAQSTDTAWGELCRQKVRFLLEIACSSNTTPNGTTTLITDLLGLDTRAVTSLRYREGDYPGQLVAQTAEGASHSVPFWRAVRHFKEHKTHRCLTCPDWLSGLADLSICDGDPDIFRASQSAQSDHPKHGRVLVRTKIGQHVLEFAIRSERIEAWPSGFTGTNLGLERKRNRRADYEQRQVPLPLGPIPGYRENLVPIPDEMLIPDLKASGTAAKNTSSAPTTPILASFPERSSP